MNNTSENELQEDSNLSQESSSEDEVVLQIPQFKPSISQMEAMQHMYMTYREGPNMDWTVTDHRFLKWKIEYENIKDCELVILSEARNARKLQPGQVILELTSMYPGACPQKIYGWR